MKGNRNLKFFATIVAFGLAAFVACKKSSTSSSSLTNTDDNGGYASDNAKLESTGNSVMAIADNATTASGAGLRTTGYPNITHDSTTTGSVVTHITTIDFGSAGVTGFDGRTRTGEIIVTYTGHYKDSGSVHTITSSNYKVDGYLVAVHKTVTNMGANTSGQDYYTVQVADSIYLTADSIISWTGNRTRTWLAGESTSTIWDDEYAISGSTTVVRANGHSFTFAIETAAPLIVATNCAYVEAGTVDISSTSFTDGTRVLNYGNTPNCDRLATVTIGSTTYNIVLRL